MTTNKPFQSKLIPYLQEIRRLRKQGWSYQRIAGELYQKYNLTISRSAIHAFVRARVRRKKVMELPDDLPDLSHDPLNLSEEEVDSTGFFYK